MGEYESGKNQAEDAMERLQEYVDLHSEHEAAQIELDENYVDDQLKEQSDDIDKKHTKYIEVRLKVQTLVRKYDQDEAKSAQSLAESTRTRRSSQSTSPLKKQMPSPKA